MKLWRRIVIFVLVAVSAAGVSWYAYTHRVTFENTAEAGLPTLMDLGAEWCPPCRQLQPILARLRDRYEGRVNIQFRDIGGADAALGDRYGVTTLPTLIFLDADGEAVQRFEGFRSEAELELEFIRLGWIS